jgi:hypothetical protein
MSIKEICTFTVKVFLLAMIILSFAHAAPDSIVDLNPVSVYETNEIEYNLTINNIGGSEIIERIRVTMPDFTITDVVNYLGWTEYYNSTYARWTDGDIEDNVWALFRYTAKAGLVDDDTIIDVSIATTGDSLESTINTVQATILNDNTPPVLTNSIPQNNSFLRDGVNDQEISVDAEDPETGIKNASFSYYDCSANATNVTIYSVELNQDNNTYSNQVDLSEYEEGELMCFEFVIYNNALELSAINGSVGFDGTAPSVYLIALDDGAYGSNNTLFSFNATDNLAPTLDCEWVVDDEVIDSAAANNGEITNTVYDMTNISEGGHEWKVRCTDWVGLSADSETRNIIVDKTPPSIVLNSPANSSMIGDNVIIDIDVFDNYELDIVNYSISLNSSELSEGVNVLVITAIDKAGNIAVAEFIFTVDKTIPTIDLISPLNNASSDVHVDFVFDIDDNLDDALDCIIYANDNAEIIQEFNINETANITVILPMDDYEWYISCNDDAGNLVESSKRNLSVTDLTGPDIISYIVYVVRTEDYSFDVNITDISGIDSVDIVFDNESLDITNNGDLYSGVIETDLSYVSGDYDLTIIANDTFGNVNVLVDGFTLVQGYVINLNLNPSTAEPEEEVIVSGTVALDDGGAIPEDFITLELPDETVNVSIDNGAFNYTFNAPDEQGDYVIRAVIVSSEGVEHSNTITLEVEAVVVQASSSSSSSSRGYNQWCGDGMCTTASSVNENCNNCPEDCGACPDKPKSTGPVEPFIEGHSSKIEVKPTHPKSSSQLEVASEKGILQLLFGGITGFAVGEGGSDISNPWLFILIFTVTVGLYTAFLIKKEPKTKNKINWENYFEKKR